MKGVSTVIVVILFLMISISITSLGYVFMIEMATKTTEAGSEVMDVTTSSLLAEMKIESLDDITDTIYVKNSGRVNLSQFNVYVNDNFVSSTPTPPIIAPGEVTSISLSPISPGDIIKVTSVQGAIAIKSVPGGGAPPVCKSDGENCDRGSECCTGNCTAGTCGPCGSCGTACSNGNYDYFDGTHTCQGNINDFCNALNGVWDACTQTGDSRDADCTGNCEAGLDYCDSGGSNPPFYWGRCVDLQNDDCSCGTCGNDCTAIGQICQDGACVPAGLAVFWSFDEGSGDIAGDNSPNNNDGNLGPSCPNCPQWVAGHSGTALTLDGNDDYVIRNPFDMPQIEVTIGFWMMTSDTTNSGTPVSYAVSGSDNEFLIYNYQAFSIYIKGASVSTGISANDGIWHHIAVTWRSSDGQIILYRDGSPAYSNTLQQGASITQGGSLVIGQEQDSVGGGFTTSQAFDGTIDEVKIYDNALTQAEIQFIMNNP